MPDVTVHLLPDSLPTSGLQGGTAVVIDILRASTTIIHALANGASAVIPCGDVDLARQIAGRFPVGDALLGGERHGKLIDGFDLDNSPFSYAPEIVAGKTIIFTTTNGTRALLASETADRILIGAFVNLSSLITELKGDAPTVHLVCAGTDGQVTEEDMLFAGVAGGILEEAGFKPTDKQTHAAIKFARPIFHDPEQFREALLVSKGGSNLVELGFDRDILRAAERDLFDIVPAWHRETQMIRKI
jgi:2-phosphosulfolactate phosphatase